MNMLCHLEPPSFDERASCMLLLLTSAFVLTKQIYRTCIMICMGYVCKRDSTNLAITLNILIFYFLRTFCLFRFQRSIYVFVL